MEPGATLVGAGNARENCSAGTDRGHGTGHRPAPTGQLAAGPGSTPEEPIELAQLGLGLAYIDRAEAQLVVRRALGQAGLIERMQPAEDGVAAHGLVVGLEDDRPAVGRHLDRPAADALRPLLR